MNMQTNKNKKEKIFLIFFFLLIIILILVFKMSCPIKKIFHVYCPGCGITRMFLSIFRLDFYQAFRYNPLVFILIPVILINRFLIKEEKVRSIIWWIMLFLVILFGVLRNIEMFDYLAPTKL